MPKTNSHLSALLLNIVCLFFCISCLYANAVYGSKDEAQAMAERAAELVRRDPDLAQMLIQKGEEIFIDRDIYVFLCNKDGLILAHAANPKLVGKNGNSFTDIDGYPLMRDILNIRDTGWVNYKWPDPSDNNKIKPKSTYIIRVGDQLVGAGYYKQEPLQSTDYESTPPATSQSLQ